MLAEFCGTGTAGLVSEHRSWCEGLLIGASLVTIGVVIVKDDLTHPCVGVVFLASGVSAFATVQTIRGEIYLHCRSARATMAMGSLQRQQ